MSLSEYENEPGSTYLGLTMVDTTSSDCINIINAIDDGYMLGNEHFDELNTTIPVPGSLGFEVFSS